MSTVHATQVIERAAKQAAGSTLNRLADHVSADSRLLEAVRTIGISHAIAVWQVAIRRAVAS